MKKIGIIGGLSAESTIEYYKFLVREYNKLKGGNSSPELVIDSLDLQKISSYMLADAWNKVLHELVVSAKNLIAAGAEVIILATNTPHKVFPALSKQVPVPMISIMEATAKEIKKQNLKKVGLLGTIFTMNSDFYPKTLEKFGIETITPTEEDKIIINKIIWEELTFHVLKPESKKQYLEIIRKLKQMGAEGVILGCTEIPLLIQQEDCDIPVFDTTSLHAKAILELALKD